MRSSAIAASHSSCVSYRRLHKHTRSIMVGSGGSCWAWCDISGGYQSGGSLSTGRRCWDSSVTRSSPESGTCDNVPSQSQYHATG